MNHFFFQPGDGWAGDPIPFYNEADRKFYLYYLHDTRETAATAYRTSWNLAVSSDLCSWEDMGTVLPPGGLSDCDLCCYTGSVIAGSDGRWHLFYTAQNPDNRDYCISGRPLQYIVHAVSRDLLHWEKHPESAFSSPAEEYEPFDWRDPHVFYDPESGQYGMLLAARCRGGSFRRGGVTLLCRSDDLVTWSRPEPFYSPGMFYTHECPDLFFLNGWWYLLFSTFTQRFATHYRMSRSLSGPWLIPDEDTFDARGMYAVKTAAAGDRRFCFGWIPTRADQSDFAHWQWGGTLVVHELVQNPDGTLSVKLPPEVLASAPPVPALPHPCTYPEGAYIRGRNAFFRAPETRDLLYDDLIPSGILTLDLKPSAGILDFGLFFHVDETLENGYYFRFEPLHRRVVFDLWPRRPLDSEQHRLNGDVPFQNGFERYLPDDCFRSMHLTVVCSDTILVLYINNRTAMSVRICRPNRRWGLFATRGALSAEHIHWHRFP